MTREALATAAAPQAIGPYSQGVRAGGLVFVSGQIALSPDGSFEGGDIRRQTERCLANIAAILQVAGLELHHVAKTTVYLADLADFSSMNDVYGRFFEAPYPARATVEVKALPQGALVEIEALAVN